MERASPGQPLIGQVAFVAGGSGGIGGAIAVALAAAGADVAVTYRSGGGRAQEVVEQIAAQGRRAIALEADLRDRVAVDRAVAAALGALGRIDVLVTAVGAGGLGFFMRQEEAIWEQVWETDVRGVFYCCRAVIPQMAKRQAGRVIFISSDSGKVGQLGGAVSAAARGALNAFAKSLAREVARDNVTVNVVCPGPTRTDRFEQGLLKEGDANVWERVLQSVPLKRAAEPREVASLVVYLSSPDGGYVTGQALSVSGGLTMV
jgi:NAD(P)-dependent dehydrogenase (short-subunit alcohol dehydrogenase family)